MSELTWGAIFWFTGLPCSGKTTIGEQLSKGNARFVHLDGDVLRKTLCADLGFSLEDRQKNLERIAGLAVSQAKLGNTVIVSTISPTEAQRNRVRKICENSGIDFHLVYVKADLPLCIERDVKGMYAKAFRGEIQNFTGVSSPYEPPRKPDLVFDTRKESLEQIQERFNLETAVHDYLSDYRLSNRKPGLRDKNYRLSLHPLSYHSQIPVCLITMARSGTNFLIAYLSYGLSRSKKWCGAFIGPPVALDGAEINPRQLKALIQKQRISWCHADGGNKNVALLKKLDHPVLLQMRDPRQAFLSWIHHERSYKKELGSLSWEEISNLYLHRDFPKYVQWVAQWLDAIQNDPSLKIKLSFYEEMVRDTQRYVRELLRVLNFPEEQFDWPPESVICDWKSNQSNQIHYRKGMVDEWRSAFSESQIQFMNNLMPDSFFSMTPWSRYP
jgi:adenylyl-sulfate kinase